MSYSPQIPGLDKSGGSASGGAGNFTILTASDGLYESVIDIDPAGVTNHREINSLNLINRHASATSGVRFSDKNFDANTNNTEKGAVGYGNASQGAPYGSVVFLASSDLSGVAPYTPATLVPVRLIQYGRCGGVDGDFATLEADSNGDLKVWRNAWASKAISLMVKQSGYIGIGLDTPVYPLHLARDGVQINGNFYLTANFQNTATTKGAYIGYNTSTNAAIFSGTGDLEFWTFNGSGSWLTPMTIVKTGGITMAYLVTANAGITITSGQALKLGNAATTGLTAGVLSALTNASITITDSTGTVYRIPCIV